VSAPRQTASMYEQRDHVEGSHDRWYIGFEGVKDVYEMDYLTYSLKASETFQSSPCKTYCSPCNMALFKAGTYPELPKTAEEAKQRSSKIEISYRKYTDPDPHWYPDPLSPQEPITITMGENSFHGLTPYPLHVDPYIDIMLTQDGETSKITDAYSVEKTEPGQDESQSSPVSDGIISINKYGTYHVRVKYSDPRSHRDIYSNWLEVVVHEGFCSTDSENENGDEYDDEYDEETGGIRKCIVTGEYTGEVGAAAVSLDDVLTVEYFSGNDEDGKGNTWESLEDDGISIDDLGRVTFTEPGTYHVRMLSNTCVIMSDWAEITAIVPEVPVKPSHGPAYTPQGGGSAVSLSSSAENTSSSSSSSRASSKRRSPIDGKKITYTIGTDGIVLTWDKVNKAQSYTVFMLRGGKAIKLAETKDTSYTYTGAKTGEKYVFMVKYTTKDRPGLSRASESYRITVSTSAKKPAVSASAKDSKVR
ncbi:MAG: hypothetical protein II695_12945, partial [Oscillospiraceae bacterium]|nr:hypothetical protein [Oscillospiraceae bacterium]